MTGSLGAVVSLALGALLTLSACSGDDSNPGGDSSSSGSSSGGSGGGSGGSGGGRDAQVADVTVGDAPAGGDGAGDAPSTDGTTGDGGADGAGDDGATGDGAPADVSPLPDSGGDSAPDAATLLPTACTSVCGAGQKLCDEQCVSVDDPSYGCDPQACTPCLINGATYQGPAAGAVASLTCKAGRCSVATCPTGWADCDGVFSNLCEADLTSAQHCGACGNACSSSQLCIQGACMNATACTFPQLDCSGTCRDSSSDPQACGGCTTGCATPLFSEQLTCGVPQGATQPACGKTVTCAAGATQRTCDFGGPGSFDMCWPSGDSTGPCPCYACALGKVCSSGQCVARCPAGYGQCPSGCSDTSSDPANCGTCGHACAGQACVEGQCVDATSVQFVTGLSAPKGLAVDATNLYVTDPGTNTVWQINKSTLTKTPLGTGQANPGDVAVDATYAYWSSAGGQAILRAPIGGATAFQPVYSTAAGDAFLGVDGTDVYWIDQNGMHAAPKAGGGTVRDVGTGPMRVQATALSQDATTLYGAFYWSFPGSYSSVGRIDKATGALTLEGGESGQTGVVAAVAVDANNLYSIETYGTSDPSMPGPPVTIPAARLWREAKAGGASFSDEVPPPGQGQSLHMAADGCTVYWAAGTKIYRASPGGSPPHVLTSAAASAGEIVLDASYVYWVDSGWIGRVAR